LFLCGLFIPITNLPVFLRPLSYVFPLTYGADILKSAVNGNGILPLWVDFPVLLAFAAVLFLMSLRNIRRKWIS
jgi:ABC-2 type transport system permease protein